MTVDNFPVFMPETVVMASLIHHDHCLQLVTDCFFRELSTTSVTEKVLLTKGSDARKSRRKKFFIFSLLHKRTPG